MLSFSAKVKKYDNYSKKVIKYLHILNKCHIFVSVKETKFNKQTDKDMTQMNAIAITTKDAQRLSVIATRTHATTAIEIAMAGAKMQMIHELKERMKTSVVEFYFVKRDGTLRHAYGTTMPSLAAKHINGRGIPRESVKTTPFFCVESGEWRSLRWESIVKVC